MNHARTQARARSGVAVLVAMALALVGCGLSDDGTVSSTGKKDGTTSTSKPGMRKPRSLCERVPHETVEALSQLKLDLGNPSERNDYPECTWRRRGNDVAVTATLEPPMTVSEFKERFGSEDSDEEIPDLGELAFWNDGLDRMSVLADEGVFEVSIYNYDLSESVIQDADIELIRVLMDTTEVPDTTTTTSSVPTDGTGLCARFPLDVVEKESGLNLDPGTSDGGGGADERCAFRERAQGVVVDIKLFDPDSFDVDFLTEVEDNDEAGVPSKISISSRVIYAETAEGVLSIQILNFDQSDDQWKAAAITLVKQFLASA